MNLLTLSDWHDYEAAHLAPYAVRGAGSRGRRYPEPDHPYRSPFQRDRERVVHSSAFRRMTGKTQVLVASVNDHHRTRLTHTLEVAQIARTAARRLRLNEDLTEAIALAHDIGHPPFGHAGEQELDRCLAADGGFNHNLFGLRRVDVLEDRYPEFPGLNLTYEVREAFVAHAGMADRFPEFASAGRPPLEAQVVDAVDGLAYTSHDLDDALGLGFLTYDDLAGVECWARAVARVRGKYPGLGGPPLRTAVVRELLAWHVADLIEETARKLSDTGVRSASAVREFPGPLVGLTAEVEGLNRELRAFLRGKVYRHADVVHMTTTGRRVLRALFDEYVGTPELLPEKHLRRWSGAANPSPRPGRDPEPSLPRTVADYLAGMTDRFALREYRRLFQPSADM